MSTFLVAAAVIAGAWVAAALLLASVLGRALRHAREVQEASEWFVQEDNAKVLPFPSRSSDTDLHAEEQ